MSGRRDIESDARDLDAHAANLRKELNRIATLHNWDPISVRVNKGNKVPSVDMLGLKHVFEPGADFKTQHLPDTVAPPLLDIIHTWHAEHPFCRMLFEFFTYSWNATEPWPHEEWRAALKAAISSKKDANLKRKAEEHKDHASRKKMSTNSQAQKPSKPRPDTRAMAQMEVLEGPRFNPTHTGEHVAVEVVASPDSGTICVRVVTPGKEKELNYAVGDVISAKTMEIDSWIGDVVVKRVSGMFVFVEGRRWTLSTRVLRFPVLEFAADQLGLFFKEKSISKNAGAVLVRTQEELDAFVETISERPLPSVLNVLENIDSSIVVSEKVFDVLTAAYTASDANEELKTRIHACIEKLSKPSAPRMAVSLEAALS